MAYRWPADTDFSLWELDVLDRNCPVCGRMMHICDHRYRRFHTLDADFHGRKNNQSSDDCRGQR